MKPTRFLLSAWTALAGWTTVLPAQTSAAGPTITVNLTEPGPAIAPTMFGVFFEDINFGADGGLWAELVKNRSFEFPKGLMGWNVVGTGVKAEVIEASPLGMNNRHALRLEVSEAGTGIANEGFRGIGVRSAGVYRFRAFLRTPDRRARVRVSLCTPDGQRLAEERLSRVSGNWRRLECSLRPLSDEPKAQLRLTLEQPGTIEVDLVSLFPQEALQGPLRGLRPDLVQMLKELRPGFLRFPGGCIVEGRELATRYPWKSTVTYHRDDRPLLINRWNQEFKHRPAPDYYQTFALGFYEYFLLAEYLGASPMPIINCGMACQFNSNELAPMDQLDSYIQDALDLIEFANGPVTSPWGKRRAELGHPAPFNVQMLGIGNEQWGTNYLPRLDRFTSVLRARYPELRLIGSVGLEPAGPMFEFMTRSLRERKIDIIDEHSYNAPAWFYAQANRYNNYPRGISRIFVGEYGAQTAGIARPDNRNTWECALAEAAFMTGLERNPDVVQMSAYAPLFGHTDAWQWTPNLIWFDNLRVYGTPNYYVQQAFARNRGATAVPVTIDGSTRNGENNLYVSAATNDAGGEIILKVVNASSSARTVQIDLLGVRKVGLEGRAIVIANPDLNAINGLETPLHVCPTTAVFPLSGPSFEHGVPGYSLNVLRIPYK